MGKRFDNERAKALAQCILSLETEQECFDFLEDICTVKEMEDLTQRLEVAQLLMKHKKYQDIAKETGASTATISRVNRTLMYGNDGYETVLKRIKRI
ncbi:MAG: TrpR YerC/YecD [Lachnospiraceae bacterium]|nr:TrpR YerC/YecD [Lachnospiraceae bacterium]